jgi:hypothetical protein
MFPLLTEEAIDADGPKPINNADEAILSTLNENPFASVWQLSRFTHIHPTAVDGYLIQSLAFTACHLRWVPLLCQTRLYLTTITNSFYFHKEKNS